MFFSFNYSLKFSHSSSPVMNQIIFFHENCLFIIMFVLSMVLMLLLYKFFNYYSSMMKMENSMLEIIWTMIPTFMILSIMIPSLELLYFSEETGGSNLISNMKITGHQWYWSYETQLIVGSSFDSYLINLKDLTLGEIRKVEVDRPLMLQYGLPVRLLITSADVMHSWAVPEFGVKVDAVPGRLNQVVVYPSEVGRFYGFCSELCGVNHSFMPMILEVLN